MAEQKDKKEPNQTTAAKTADRTRLGVRLAPADNSDQPVLANYTALNAAPGIVFIDFGFLEPAMLNAIPRVAKSGGKLPESVNGRLAVRVAVGLDTLRGLKQQIDALVAAANRPRGNNDGL